MSGMAALLALLPGVLRWPGRRAGAPYGCGAVSVSRECEGRAAKRPSLAGLRAKSALVLGDYGLPHALIPGTGALLAMQHNGWDHALKVTAGGTGLVGHAGAVLLRKAADQAGLTGQLSTALRKKGTSPAFDRGIVLVSLAAAIALGATSMSDIALLAHLAPVLGDAPSGPTARRALDLAGTPAMLDKIARARARARAHVWQLIEDTPAGSRGCRSRGRR